MRLWLARLQPTPGPDDRFPSWPCPTTVLGPLVSLPSTPPLSGRRGTKEWGVEDGSL